IGSAHEYIGGLWGAVRGARGLIAAVFNQFRALTVASQEFSVRALIRISLAMPLLFAALPLSASNLPDPPEGFSWKRIEEVRATFLLPKGWYFKSEESGGTRAYFLTPEKVKNGAPFDTGLTINVTKNLKDKDAVAYARAFIGKAAEMFETIDQ